MSLHLTYRKGRAFLDYALRRTNLAISPLHFIIDIASACNLKCVTCPQAFPKPGLKRGIMTPDTFRRVLEYIRDMQPVSGISLYLAGEPLVHPNFSELLRITVEILKMQPWIASNGTLWTEEIIRSFVDDGLGGVQVDFSADRDIFAKARDNADWDLVRNSIKRLLEYRTERKQSYPTVTIKDVVLTKHITEEAQEASLARLRALFDGYPVDSFVPYKLHNWAGRFAERVEEDPDYSTGPSDLREYYPCSHLWFSMSIAWDGQVVACCRDSESDAVVGNVHDKSLREIWNDTPLRRMRELMAQKRHEEIALCAKCDRMYTGGYSGGTPVRMVLDRLKTQLNRLQ